MSFVSYNTKEDMQDDTYKIVTQLVIECARCDLENNVEGFYKNLRVLFLLVWKRLPQDDSKQIEQNLEVINNALYGLSVDPENTGARSILFDMCEEVFKKMTGSLDNILYRMRADLDSLVAQ